MVIFLLLFVFPHSKSQCHETKIPIQEKNHYSGCKHLVRTKLYYVAGESFNRQGEDRIFTSAPTAEALNHHLQSSCIHCSQLFWY